MDNPPPYSPPGVQPLRPYRRKPVSPCNKGFRVGNPFTSNNPLMCSIRPKSTINHPRFRNDHRDELPVLLGAFGPNPQCITCPHCNNTLVTRVNTEPTTKTHLVAFVMCLFMCWPCCLLPYCMDSCQSRNHYCYHCGAFLGSYN